MLRVMPFKFVNAFTDIKNKVIYLSSNIKKEDITDVIYDEFGHILSNSSEHDDKWKDTCQKFYGFIPKHNNKYDNMICGFGMNIGNITGIQNMLLDYHLLQAYRKFSRRVLGTEGSWEVDGNNKIRLKPTPKGSFPVVVRYIPSVDDFQIPTHKEVLTRYLIAEAKIILGHTRRKMSIPGPDGSQLGMDGEALVTEGREEKKELIELAYQLGEPLGFIVK